MASNTVYIKSVQKPSIQKREDYTLANGRRVYKTKAKNSGTRLCFSYSVSKGILNTGFWELVSNLWQAKSSEDSNLPSNWKDSNVWAKSLISKQTFLEIKHNKPAGTYDSSAASMFEDNIKGTYIQNFSYFFKDGITVLDLDIPEQEIAYEMCKMSNKVAKTKEDINPYQHILYIAQINEAENEKAARREVIESAIATLYQIKQKYPDSELFKLAVTLELVRGETPAEKVKNILSDFISDDAKDRFVNIKRFGEMVKIMTDKETAAKFQTMYLLQELVNNRIVSDYQGKYQWGNAPSSELRIIGKTKDQAIMWLMDIDSRDFRKMICEELKAKTGLKLS